MLIKKKHIYFTSAGVITLGVLLLFARKQFLSFDYKTNLLLLSLKPGFRKKVVKFLTKAKQQGINLRVTSGYRTCEQQDKLYAKGRTASGKIVTNAKCGESTHNYRKAIDVVEFKNGKPLWENPNWQKIGQIGESFALTWGGRWKFQDKPHFQDLDMNKM